MRLPYLPHLTWLAAGLTRDCLLESLEFQERWRQLKQPARVLVYKLNPRLMHAVCVVFHGQKALVYDAVKGVTFLPAGLTESSPAELILSKIIAGRFECWWFEDVPPTINNPTK